MKETAERHIVAALDQADTSPAGVSRMSSILHLAEELERTAKLPLRHFSAASSKPGQVVEGLMDLAKGRQVELYVVGMRHLNVIQGLYLGSVTEELARHSRRPVVVMGPRTQSLWAEKGKLLRPLRFLVATDLGRSARPVEHYALTAARRTGASVTLLHNAYDTYRSWEDSAVLSGMVPIDFEESVQTTIQSADDNLAVKAAFFKERGVPCDVILDRDLHTAAQSVIEHHRDGYSMIFMGTRGRNRVLRAFLGSTFRETLMGVTLPVVAVKG